MKEPNKADWDIMFFCVLKCCLSCTNQIVKKQNAGYKLISKEDCIELIEDYARNSATEIMARYKKPKGYRIKYLATVCRNQCFHNIERENEKINRNAVHSNTIGIYKGE